MAARHHLVLTENQRTELIQTRDRDPRPYLREGATALLKIAEGRSPHWVAGHGLPKPRHPDTVYTWLTKYRQSGLAGLVHRPRGQRGLSPLQTAELIELLHQSPTLHGLSRSRWRLDDLSATLPSLRAYSRTGISQVLRRLGIRRKRGRLSLHSPDPWYHHKLDWIERACTQAQDRPNEVVVCYGDEFTLYRQPTLAPIYAALAETPTAPLSHRSNRTHRYSGALNLITGQLTWSDAPKMGVDALRAFLRQLRHTYPDQQLILVWDNWPVHLQAQVLAEAAEQAIELLWLPTYAPWTNPIEKLWLWLKQTVLPHHRLADQWSELTAQVAAFFNQFIRGSTALLRVVGRLPD